MNTLDYYDVKEVGLLSDPWFIWFCELFYDALRG
jgi:hypothetical protein